MSQDLQAPNLDLRAHAGPPLAAAQLGLPIVPRSFGVKVLQT